MLNNENKSFASTIFNRINKVFALFLIKLLSIIKQNWLIIIPLNFLLSIVMCIMFFKVNHKLKDFSIKQDNFNKIIYQNILNLDKLEIKNQTSGLINKTASDQDIQLKIIDNLKKQDIAYKILLLKDALHYGNDLKSIILSFSDHIKSSKEFDELNKWCDKKIKTNSQIIEDIEDFSNDSVEISLPTILEKFLQYTGIKFNIKKQANFDVVKIEKIKTFIKNNELVLAYNLLDDYVKLSSSKHLSLCLEDLKEKLDLMMTIKKFEDFCVLNMK